MAEVSFTGESGGYSSLKTLGPNGEVPHCRMQNAMSVQDRASRLIDDDSDRAMKRGWVNGLVDGNPPYNQARLRKLGRSEDCDANWGTGRATWEAAYGSLFDLISQAPGFVSLQIDYGHNQESRLKWQLTMSEQADRIFRREKGRVTTMQLSQQATILHGKGPLYFDRFQGVFPRYAANGMILVPDRAPCSMDRWEELYVIQEYYPPELYSFIRDRDAASAVGWNVAFTENVIRNAMDQKRPVARLQNEEWWQDEVKTNSFNYVDTSLVCRVAHAYWREYPEEGSNLPGRVTHAIVEVEPNANKSIQYLFIHVGRYKDFSEIIHPMYYDAGRDDLYHNVTGLGTKQYGPVEYENRLRCRIMDKAFAPDILFRSTSAEAREQFQLTYLGPWGVVGPGYEMQQMPVRGLIGDSLSVLREAGDITRSNLGQYRLPVQPDKPGNPDTATEARMKAGDRGALSNTVFSRYEEQVDGLYAEIVRRLFDPNSSDPRAIECQKRCRERGVPAECFGRIKEVQSVRVVGQGSQWMRQQAIVSCAPFVKGSSELGQRRWRHDGISANAGPAAVERWDPQAEQGVLPDEQQERAANQITGMHAGQQAVIADSQDAMVFANAFIKAAQEALGSLKQGGDPHEVARFVGLAGPGAARHLARMAGDPLREEAKLALEAQLKKIGSTLDKLKNLLTKQSEQQQAQQQKAQGVMSDAQIKAMKVKGDLALKGQKQQATLAMQAQKHQQALAIQDATAASQIQINRYRALSE